MLTETEQDELERVAEQAATHTESHCADCGDHVVDPLGTIAGINTPANKAINSLTDDIMERKDFDPICQSEIHMELVEKFHKRFRQKIKDKQVDTQTECFYCFEEKQEQQIFVSQDPDSVLITDFGSWL